MSRGRLYMLDSSLYTMHYLGGLRVCWLRGLRMEDVNLADPRWTHASCA